MGGEKKKAVSSNSIANHFACEIRAEQMTATSTVNQNGMSNHKRLVSSLPYTDKRTNEKMLYNSQLVSSLYLHFQWTIDFFIYTLVDCGSIKVKTATQTDFDFGWRRRYTRPHENRLKQSEKTSQFLSQIEREKRHGLTLSITHAHVIKSCFKCEIIKYVLLQNRRQFVRLTNG